MTSIDVLFKLGQDSTRRTGDARELAKIGTLRAGSTGCILEDGRVLGACPRRAYLRMKGIQFRDFNADRELMLNAGVGNEVLWVDVLKAGADCLQAAERPSFKQEEECPIEWECSNGTKVTGRPDIVKINAAGAPDTLLELKLVSSLWTAHKVAFKMRPKVEHVLQAAHYAWKLGVPAELWYTNRTSFAVMGDWAGGLFPRAEHPYTDLGLYKSHWQFDERLGKETRREKAITREEYDALPAKERSASVKSVLPFRQGYQLEFDPTDDTLMYRPIVNGDSPATEAGEWTETVITKQGIERFYETVSRIDETNILPVGPAALEADGSKMSYKPCIYCPINKIHLCSDKSISARDWLEKVKQHVAIHGLELTQTKGV